jgi:hypothetical protein
MVALDETAEQDRGALRPASLDPISLAPALRPRANETGLCARRRQLVQFWEVCGNAEVSGTAGGPRPPFYQGVVGSSPTRLTNYDEEF